MLPDSLRTTVAYEAPCGSAPKTLWNNATHSGCGVAGTVGGSAGNISAKILLAKARLVSEVAAASWKCTTSLPSWPLISTGIPRLLSAVGGVGGSVFEVYIAKPESE